MKIPENVPSKLFTVGILFYLNSFIKIYFSVINKNYVARNILASVSDSRFRRFRGK